MLDLNGIVPVEVIHELTEYTQLRFRSPYKYKCAEALGMYEQRLLSNDMILSLCEKAEGMELSEPPASYIPEDILMQFKGYDVVPVSYSPIRKVVTVITLNDLSDECPIIPDLGFDVVKTTIYNYFAEYTKHFGPHPDLLEIPAKQLLDAIVREAIDLGAADITISSMKKSSNVYYNVRKKKIYSQRIISSSNMEDIIKLLCFESPIDNNSNAPKYVGVSLNEYYRGRVVINPKYHGYAITIRLLPNAAFDKKLEDCNLTKESIKWLRDAAMNNELGIRIIAGATMSGKNTTALAILNEYTVLYDVKVVSIEMPVEQELVSIEQIDCADEAEYELNINSLIRQNPDFVYITEIGDTTAIPVMRMANTGKKVLATLHANSCADVISRLMDITKLSTDRIIQSLHSIVYQELVRDEEKDIIFPKIRYCYLSRERKNELYGKSYGEVVLKIQQWEGGDVW